MLDWEICPAVERSLNRVSGAWVFKNSRVPVTVLFENLRETVPRLVMATKQHRASGDPDAEVVINIDLSVLGQTEPRFLQYENQIRQEYDWVPAPIFSAKRAEILERFLDRERIFTLDWFWTRFERQARQNLSASIQALRQR
jgi:predicted metal-dependent HD superfamily phosphohydrolase